MKIKNIFLAACLFAATMASAQEAEAPASPWKFSGVVGLNASATGLVNWAAGGNNNVSGIVFGKFNLDYAENNLAWNTILDLEYGLTWVDQKYDKMQKASDRIKFDTKFGYQFADKVFVAANAAFQTQFANGRSYTGDVTYNDVISKFLAPSYTDISVGIDYKPVDFFSLYVSPVAGRITTAYISNKMNQNYEKEVADFVAAHPELIAETNVARYAIVEGHDGLRQELQEAYGTWKFDDMNKKVYRNARAELGLSVKANLNYAYEDLKIMSTLGLFTPYAWDKVVLYTAAEDGANYTEKEMETKGYDIAAAQNLGYRDNNRRFGNFDVNWDVAISYRFLKCLNVTLSTSLKYINGLKIDKTYDKGLPTEKTIAAERVQFQGIIGLGVGYSF